LNSDPGRGIGAECIISGIDSAVRFEQQRVMLFRPTKSRPCLTGNSRARIGKYLTTSLPAQ
jgi:hypothetical protein